jgi:prepilin-type N-terminal cleavage/methylation domain-containing protein
MYRNPPQNQKGFTLLEMIVVVIVIGIMAAAIIPRLSGSRDREFNLLVDQVADVVLMFAHRSSSSNQPSGLRYDPDLHRFELLAKFKEDEGHYWDIDPLAVPIRFPEWLEENKVEIFIDGELADTSQWPITVTPGESRPLVEVALGWEERYALISLSSHSIGPHIWLDGIGTEPLMPIDLDAQGRGREEW